MRPWLFLFLVLTLSLEAGAYAQRPGASISEYFGYENCVVLENANVRAVLTEHGGGRILEYSIDGNNAIYLDPAQRGLIFDGVTTSVGPTGGRFDIGPERTIPAHPDLWMGKWRLVISGPRAARMVSAEDEATGVQLIRDFELDQHSSHLRVTQTIKNISNVDKHWAHWSRSFGTGGGVVLIPLTPESRFPNKYVMYGPGPVINYEPHDTNIVERSGFLEVLGAPARPKLGMDSFAGWLAYAEKNDLLWIKRFPTYPDRPYKEIAGLTISIWYYEDQMTELEPIGPREQIAPGQSASFTEDWWLFPYEHPEGGKIDLVELTSLVETYARVGARGGGR